MVAARARPPWSPDCGATSATLRWPSGGDRCEQFRQALAALVPTFLQRRIPARALASCRPSAETLSAAIVLADMVGFTALSERLGTWGCAEPEQLSAITNQYFDRLIETIVAHGVGDICSAGDAVLSCGRLAGFPDSLSRATRLAARVRCRCKQPGVNAAGQRRSFASSGDTSAGEVRSLRSHGDAAAELRPPLEHASAAQAVTVPGQVVVSEPRCRAAGCASRSASSCPRASSLTAMTEPATPARDRGSAPLPSGVIGPAATEHVQPGFLTSFDGHQRSGWPSYDA